MTLTTSEPGIVEGLDVSTRELVSLAIVIATGDEPALRSAMARAVERALDPQWVEELMQQSYLVAGFPRALTAAREWRRASGRTASTEDETIDPERAGRFRERGERTCATVYGDMYQRLRTNIRALHP